MKFDENDHFHENKIALTNKKTRNNPFPSLIEKVKLTHVRTLTIQHTHGYKQKKNNLRR